jgi:hypothetical protein
MLSLVWLVAAATTITGARPNPNTRPDVEWTVVAQAQGERPTPDSSAILLAVAKYLAPKLDTTLVLDPRPSYKRANAHDRAIAGKLAQLLRLRVGRYNEVIHCGQNCRFPGARGVMALNDPVIHGDTARVNVERTYDTGGRLSRGGQEYILTRIQGVWRVTGLGITTFDS